MLYFAHPQGRNLLSGDMLDYIPDQNVDSTAAQELQRTAIEDPAVLLGWQVRAGTP